MDRAVHVPKNRLLNIPMFKAAIHDPGFKIRERGVDANWIYETSMPNITVGYNPFRSEVYVPGNGAVMDWVRAEENSNLRELNENDTLINDVLFLTHDYIHAWSVKKIQELWPEIGFGTAPISSDNFELFVYSILLTEAAATVGLDYWYLSLINLEEQLQIGTTVKNLTVSYRQEHIREYEVFGRETDSRKPSFYREIAQFYCTGVFSGFEIDDLRKSPCLLGWLRHELKYGELQRVYTRRWLQYLSGKEFCSPTKLGQPISIEEEWVERLTVPFSELLWDKVREPLSDLISLPTETESLWSAKQKEDGLLDFRFVNLNALDAKVLADVVSGKRYVSESATHLQAQLIWSRKFPSDKLARIAVDQIRRSNSIEAIYWTAQKMSLAEGQESDTVPDLFMLS